MALPYGQDYNMISDPPRITTNHPKVVQYNACTCHRTLLRCDLKNHHLHLTGHTIHTLPFLHSYDMNLHIYDVKNGLCIYMNCVSNEKSKMRWLLRIYAYLRYLEQPKTTGMMMNE